MKRKIVTFVVVKLLVLVVLTAGVVAWVGAGRHGNVAQAAQRAR